MVHGVSMTLSVFGVMTNHVDSSKCTRALRYPQEILSQLRDTIVSSGLFAPYKAVRDIRFCFQVLFCLMPDYALLYAFRCVGLSQYPSSKKECLKALRLSSVGSVSLQHRRTNEGDSRCQVR